MNWVGPDLRGRILEKFATKPPRPWSTDISAARTQRGRYIQKADRPRSRDWNFCVHLDQQELDAAIQFHHDWKLAGLGFPTGVVDDLITDGDGGVHITDDLCIHPTVEPIAIGPEARRIEVHVCLTEAELRDMAKPKAAAEKSVEDLVLEYLANGGTIKVCKAFMTRRGPVERIVEWVVPKGAPRDVGVCDLAHAMPLNWSQARQRRVYRWARTALRKDEASLVEVVVLYGARTNALPMLKAALQKLAKHYENFDPAEDLRKWESGVHRNLGVAT